VRPGYESLRGFDPDDPGGPGKEYFFGLRDLDAAWKFARWKVQNLRTAARVLASPEVVYYGTRVDWGEEGLCFCGRPELHYDADGRRLPFPEGCLYCVFVGPRDVVYEWRIERAERVEEGGTLALRRVEFRFRGIKWARKR
jgi:hypothetical protein